MRLGLIADGYFVARTWDNSALVVVYTIHRLNARKALLPPRAQLENASEWLKKTVLNLKVK